jgi:hypothetical protein
MEKKVEELLETLWALRDGDKFYFMEYGELLIEELKKNL